MTGEPQGRDPEIRYTDHAFTPYVGLSYDLTPSVTLYASYAESFKPQGDKLAADGTPLKPITGITYEAGAKGSWMGGTLTASLAYYESRRRNVGFLTTESSELPGCCYVAAESVHARGVDAEVTGEILPGWQLFASYNYNVNRYNTGDNAGLAFFPQTPRHLFKLWTMARLPGALADLRLGGGINAQSKTYQSGTAVTYDPDTGQFNGPEVPFRYSQGAYAIVSLRGEWRITDEWSLALNVNNLFDKRYYETVGTSANGNFYGEPRSFQLSLRGSF